MWKKSPPHRKNMLNKKFRLIGVASAKGADGRTYWVQMFAGKR